MNRSLAWKTWAGAQIRPNHLSELQRYSNTLMSFKTTYYDPAEKQSGVPWYVIGALDCREEDFNHNCYLGNGDPLSRPTHHVPRGRGPFKTWADGAADALMLDGWNKLPAGQVWDISNALTRCEKYNGMGYATRGILSPYVWALTNKQQPGKYVADGQFDSRTWDSQPGCAALFLALKQFHGVNLMESPI